MAGNQLISLEHSMCLDRVRRLGNGGLRLISCSKASTSWRTFTPVCASDGRCYGRGTKTKTQNADVRETSPWNGALFAREVRTPTHVSPYLVVAALLVLCCILDECPLPPEEAAHEDSDTKEEPVTPEPGSPEDLPDPFLLELKAHLEERNARVLQPVAEEETCAGCGVKMAMPEASSPRVTRVPCSGGHCGRAWHPACLPKRRLHGRAYTCPRCAGDVAGENLPPEERNALDLILTQPNFKL